MRRFVETLNDHLPNAVDRIPDGTQNDFILASKSDPDKRGYAVTLVPQSDSIHQAVFKIGKETTRQYYKRMSDQQRLLHQHEVEELFGRRQKPDLDIELECKRGSEFLIHIQPIIHNRGRWLAKHVAAMLEMADHPYSVPKSSHWLRERETYTYSSTGRRDYTDLMIHPQMPFRTQALSIQRSPHISFDSPIELSFRLYCEGTAEKHIKHRVVPSELPEN
ncbi:MAG: hypothetical protein O3A46_01440 [Candidatus Poribacteria bacterium]|nr:hypothetical protein [Candidatus Poribacteria bacterium]